LAIDDRGLMRQPQGLVDILDKILDNGLVVAGDIKSLAGERRAIDDSTSPRRLFDR